MASSTAEPTAQATGLPPNVLKCRACDITEAISLVVTTAAIGNPLAIPKETGKYKVCQPFDWLRLSVLLVKRYAEMSVFAILISIEAKSILGLLDQQKVLLYWAFAPL